MIIGKDIIGGVGTPTDKAIESDKHFDTILVQGLWGLIEKMIVSTDNRKQNYKDTVPNGVREIGHNHGYGSDEIYNTQIDIANNELIGRHLPKRAVTIDQVEDVMQTVTEPLAVVPHVNLDNPALSGGIILNNHIDLIKFLVSPGTVNVNIVIGVKSSGATFDVAFNPLDGLDGYFTDADVWTAVAANAATVLTWITVAINVNPYAVFDDLAMAVAGKNFTDDSDLRVWAIRVIENV